MASANTNIRCLLSAPQPCSYLPHQQTASLYIDPTLPIDDHLYSALAAQGFRRSGHHFYRPQCPRCQACIPLRIPVHSFCPDRSQRRIWRRNRDITVNIQSAVFDDQHFALYRRYLNARHAAPGMDVPTPQEYMSFLTCQDITTYFVEFHHQGQLLCVAVVDQFNRGWSAVYTFFDPDKQSLSPGVFSILWQIEYCRNSGRDYLYLGFWIDACRKMSYKTRYQPFQIYTDGDWKQR